MWGAKAGNGSWTGLIGDILSGRIDISLPYLLPTEDRIEVVDVIPVRVVPAGISFVFNVKHLWVDSGFRWWRAFTDATLVCLVFLVIMKFVFLNNHGTKSWPATMGTGIVLSFYRKIVKSYLLPQLVQRKRSPFNSYSTAAENIKLKNFNLALLSSAAISAMVQSDPLFLSIRQAIQINPAKYFLNMKDAYTAIVKAPNTVYLGSDYECNSFRFHSNRIHCRYMSSVGQYFSTSMLSYQSKCIKSEYTRAYRHFQATGLIARIFQRYSWANENQVSFGKRDQSKPIIFTFSQMCSLFYGYILTLHLSTVGLLTEIAKRNVRAKQRVGLQGS